MEAAGKTYIEHPSSTDSFTLWGIGDIHKGAPGCEWDRVKRDVKKIEDDPHSFWVGLGDYADFITVKDKRFDADHLDNEAKLNIGRLGNYYMETIRDLFQPITHKCIGLIYGNHEEKFMIHNEQADLHGWLCTELGVPNLKYCAIKDLVFVRRKCKSPKIIEERGNINESTARSFRCFFHHGAGGSVTPGGKLKKLLDFMSMFPDCDIYMVGHTHESIGKRMPVISVDQTCTKLVERQKIGTICGSYLKTYTQGKTSYGEKKAYAPTSLGPSRVFIHPETRELRGEI